MFWYLKLWPAILLKELLFQSAVWGTCICVWFNHLNFSLFSFRLFHLKGAVCYSSRILITFVGCLLVWRGFALSFWFWHFKSGLGIKVLFLSAGLNCGINLHCYIRWSARCNVFVGTSLLCIFNFWHQFDKLMLEVNVHSGILDGIPNHWVCQHVQIQKSHVNSSKVP